MPSAPILVVLSQSPRADSTVQADSFVIATVTKKADA
jgi:hypothetical protein